MPNHAFISTVICHSLDTNFSTCVFSKGLRSERIVNHILDNVEGQVGGHTVGRDRRECEGIEECERWDVSWVVYREEKRFERDKWEEGVREEGFVEYGVIKGFKVVTESGVP